MYRKNKQPSEFQISQLQSGAKRLARRRFAVGFALVATMFWYAGAKAVATQAQRNAEAQKLKNPVPGDAESVEAGKKLYQRHCAPCHGKSAKGDGGMSLSGGTPSDLTDETWDYGSTDGEIFVSIRDGVSADMLAYKDKLNEKQIWQVVHYLRSLGIKSEKENH
jgi:cbb3-type cytochrome c oxidase subunit III